MTKGINLNLMKSKLLVLLLCASVYSLTGQSLPQIEARFANPQYEQSTRTYYLDVELFSKTSAEILFGMNLRFFYDAAMLTYDGLDQFHQGYGFLGNPPTPIVGAPQSGIQLFGFPQAAGYINGGVQMLDERFPLTIKTDSWSKVFRVKFKVPVTVLNPEQYCPSVIWDVEAAVGQGGFLPGSAGLVITVAETNRSTRYVSKPTQASGIPFNWAYAPAGSMPHGEISPTECMNIGDLTSSNDGKADAKGYALFQNTPNPFDGKTYIEFILPYAQSATLVLFDTDGKVKEEIDGYYEAGRNRIELKEKVWMTQTAVIYYLLKTDKYTSNTLTMSVVRA